MRNSKVKGFTLLEVLVVLTVIGLMAMMVGPSLQRLSASVDRASSREGLIADIAGLSYRAFVLGQSFELDDDSLRYTLSDGNPLLSVPLGWQVRITSPISYSFNGFCSGGLVNLVGPDGQVETLKLVAPTCRVSEHA